MRAQRRIEERRGRETSARKRQRWKTRNKRKRKFVKVFSFPGTLCCWQRVCLEYVCVCVCVCVCVFAVREGRSVIVSVSVCLLCSSRSCEADRFCLSETRWTRGDARCSHPASRSDIQRHHPPLASVSYLSICLSVCPSVRPSINLSVCVVQFSSCVLRCVWWSRWSSSVTVCC